MSDRRPGFGLVPPWQETGKLWAIVTGAGLLVAVVRPLIGLALLVLGGLGLAYARHQYLAYRRDRLALQHLPPTPRAVLTALVQDAIFATPADLAANHTGQITPDQWLRIHGAVGPIHPPVLQSVAGPIALSCQSQRGRGVWYELALADHIFRAPNDHFPNALKRTATYRVYFIDAVPLRGRPVSPSLMVADTFTAIWGWGIPIRLILSAEALADA